jgi:hypothetical protein
MSLPVPIDQGVDPESEIFDTLPPGKAPAFRFGRSSRQVLQLAAIGDAVIQVAERFDLPMTAARAPLERARQAHADKP